jgi:putative oxidoreductase
MSTTLAGQSNRPDAGRALLRVVLGIIFMAHGWQKLFVFGIAGVTQAFTQMGVPLPGIAGPAVGVLEFAGGIALVLGVLTRLFALGLAVDMLVAILLVRLGGGLFAPNGFELELALCGGAAALALLGAGRWSVDAVLARRRGGGDS